MSDTTEKVAHTPGPWEVKPIETAKEYIRIRGTVLGQRFSIANVPYHSDWKGDLFEAQANARLIAAAPELLEALKDITAIAEGLLRGECYDRSGPKFLATFTNAGAAIRKAEGQ